jgi:glycosyltransferase involved in cell wall biosynthesis
LFLGRLLYAKGILEYVEMARRVRAVQPETTFSIVGWLDPNPASASPSTVDEWVRNGWVEYLGARDDVREVLASCHVLVHPSHHEGTPRSVLEAMSTGRAVITTDAPGCRETIVDRESGRLVPLGDAEALAAAALELCEKPALVVEYARRARRRAEDLYDAHQVAAHMLDFMGLSRPNTGDRSGH